MPGVCGAGGWVEFHDDFGVGNKVERKSRIDDIKFKSGNSGNLCFVAITHEFSVDGSLKIRERHDVVYRECVTAPPLLEPIKNSDATHRWHVDTDSIMLFRYSALTFNGHRIHYDLPYAVEVEGHDGLLVHGPLQATLMLNLASSIFGKLPRYMSYRGVRPLVCGNPVMIDANPTDDYLETCVRSADGNITMKAAVKL